LRFRKPFGAVPSREGSNPSPSASQAGLGIIHRSDPPGDSFPGHDDDCGCCDYLSCGSPRSKTWTSSSGAGCLLPAVLVEKVIDPVASETARANLRRIASGRLAVHSPYPNSVRLGLLRIRARGGNKVAKKTVLVSDMSGHEIEDGKGAKVRIIFNDARRGVRELDVTDEEAEKFGGRPVARRGRRPKATS
jgi:hypothetical protein